MKVTEEDRAAAVRALVAHVAGRDSEVAEIFAAHSQSAERRALERAAELIEEDHFVTGNFGLHIRDFKGLGDWLKASRAAAIRALGDK